MATKNKGKNLLNSVLVAMMVIILVVISGLIVATITNSSVFTDSTATGTVTNESGGYINATGYTLANSGVRGFTSPVITAVWNATDGLLIAAGNYTVSGAGVLTNATATTWADVNVSYTYTYTTDYNPAGVNATEVATNYGTFVTNLIAFLAVIGTIVGVVWLVLYVRRLFDKRDGLTGITA